MLRVLLNDIKRDYKAVSIAGLLWIALGLTGPLGTDTALGLRDRLIYFGVIMLGCMLLRAIRIWMLAKVPLPLEWVVWVLFLASAIAMVFGMNAWFLVSLPAEHLARGVVGLVLSVSVIIVAAQYILGLEETGSATDEGEAFSGSPAQAFFDRLPEQLHAPLIRLEAQNHRLRVVTEAGAETILMRMGDAEVMLDSVPGLRIHRSHWIALSGVARLVRRAGRDFVVMKDGAELPVSRSSREAAAELGLIAHRDEAQSGAA